MILFLLLLFGAGLILLVARRWPQFVAQTAVSISGIALLIWLIARTQLPITLNLSNWANSGILPNIAWHVDSLNWQVTVALLLLLFAASLSQLDALLPQLKSFSTLFLLTAALTAIWSANLTSMMIGVTLLILPWFIAIWQQTTDDHGRLLRYMMMIVVTVCLLWYAIAITPIVENWDLQSMPNHAVTAVALAAVILAGIWPFSGWRFRLQDVSNTEAVFAFVLPTAIGGILLARLTDSTQFNLNLQLFLSLLALFGVLRGIRLAWANLDSPRAIGMALLFAQAQLMILAGIWGNGTATIAELRVLILAGGILFLASQDPIRRELPWQAIAPIFALASLAAIPLTAGFVGRAALYSVWIENGRFLFVLVLALLTIPLITAVYVRFWPTKTATDESEIPEIPRLQDMTLGEIGRDVGVIFLAIGLFTILGVGWGDVHLLAWVMILLPIIIALVIPRFIGDPNQVQDVFQQAFSFGSAGKLGRFKNVGHDLGTAVRDAAKILEGEGGLVWLFILAILFFLLS